MTEEQLTERLPNSLRRGMCGNSVYETALRYALNKDVAVQWKCFLEDILWENYIEETVQEYYAK